MLMAGANNRPGEMIQGINVTPLVDVVLVLLIVLMVTASYTVSQALPMELPQAKTGEAKSTSLAISVSEKGELFLDGAKVTSEGLRVQVRQAKNEGTVNALIAADGRATHQMVVRVIDMIRSEGVTKFAINVAPEDLKR
jgi:biopolymer transport protein ExbD